MADICGAVLNDPPESLSRYRSDIPPGLEPVVLRCLSKDREDRFASVLELVHALEAIVPPRPRSSIRFSRAGTAPGVKSLPFLVIAETRESGSIVPPVGRTSSTDAPQAHTVAPPAPRGGAAQPGRMPLVFLLGAAAIATVVLALLWMRDDPTVTPPVVPAAAPLSVVVPPPAQVPAPEPPHAEEAEKTAGAAVSVLPAAEPPDSKAKAARSTARDRGQPASGTREAQSSRQLLGPNGIPEFGGRR